jgi:plasmid stability protein
MASLSVRRINKAVYERLRVRAALHGVSMEEEIRQILVQAVTVPTRISEVFKKHFGPENGVDLTIAERKPHHPLEFEE